MLANLRNYMDNRKPNKVYTYLNEKKTKLLHQFLMVTDTTEF